MINISNNTQNLGTFECLVKIEPMDLSELSQSDTSREVVHTARLAEDERRFNCWVKLEQLDLTKYYTNQESIKRIGNKENVEPNLSDAKGSNQQQSEATSSIAKNVGTFRLTSCKCKFKCCKTFSVEGRKIILNRFNELPTIEQQRQFIETNSTSEEFYLPLNGQKVEVCRKIFRTTLAVTFSFLKGKILTNLSEQDQNNNTSQHSSQTPNTVSLNVPKVKKHKLPLPKRKVIKMLPPCECKKKCFEKVSEIERRALFKQCFAIKSEKKKLKFLDENTAAIHMGPKRRILLYYIPLKSGIKVNVCSLFFHNTIRYSGSLFDEMRKYKLTDFEESVNYSDDAMDYNHHPLGNALTPIKMEPGVIEDNPPNKYLRNPFFKPLEPEIKIETSLGPSNMPSVNPWEEEIGSTEYSDMENDNIDNETDNGENVYIKMEVDDEPAFENCNSSYRSAGSNMFDAMEIQMGATNEKPPCSCKLRCSENISEKDRNDLFEAAALQTIEEKFEFIDRNELVRKCAIRNEYFLPSNNEGLVKVCGPMFRSILGLSKSVFCKLRTKARANLCNVGGVNAPILRPCKCKNECSTKVTIYERRDIFEKFWALNDIDKQRLFIAGNVSTAVRKNRKTHTLFLPLKHYKIKVCVEFFENTFGIKSYAEFMRI